MCSVQESGSTLVKEERASFAGRDCMKCGAPAVGVARMNDPFCKDCYRAYFVHRFRATFGKSRLVTTGEKVLLAFSGGLSSRVMLALSEEGLNQQVHKKLRYVPTVIFVDEGCVLGLSLEERCQTLAQVLTIALRSGFSVVFTLLEQVYGECEVYPVEQLGSGGHAQCDAKTEGRLSEISPSSELPPSSIPPSLEQDGATPPSLERDGATPCSLLVEPNSPQDLHQRLLGFMRSRRSLELEGRLRRVFDDTATHTAKENLLLSLRHRLLTEVGRRGGFHKILLGVNATQLAVRLLSNVAQGRGATLPLDVGFADTRTSDVMFLRPLREFPSTEVSTYATLHNLDTVSTPSMGDQSTDRSSIDHLTSSFITGLQADFPSTVNTVFRTGDKLTVSGEKEAAHSSSCSLCQAPLTLAADSSVYSHLYPPSPAMADTWRTLCYGCQLTLRDMKHDANSLPPFVTTPPPITEAHNN